MDAELPKTLTHAAYVSKKLSADMDQLIKNMAEFKADLDKASFALSASHAAIQSADPLDVDEALAPVEESEAVAPVEENAKRSHHKKS